jgi:uncharacterized protein YbaA (DUF1428 family)
MSYIDGFVIPVPPGKKDEYRAMAAMAAPIIMEHGATRIVECWATTSRTARSRISSAP